MDRVLIIGASRGIGLGLVDRHLADGWEVHATTRDGTPPRDHEDLHTHRLDVRDEDQLAQVIEEVDAPFDRIIHNAGIKNGTRAEIMGVNTEAPIRIVEALLDAGLLVDEGRLAIMTSQLGAREKRSAAMADYSDSKAALNDLFRERADDWREQGAIAIVMHPGWVRTDMGGDAAAISIVESADGITDVLDHASADDHGRFLTWRGDEHPW